jgi:hypothetical protein
MIETLAREVVELFHRLLRRIAHALGCLAECFTQSIA